ncbi:MAG: class I SAM-dependent methyltransferase, partial [Rickettsiales bacterium]|nr:class I SAM-dependent methyltransferase [Rickettsiales bacterium]
YAVDLLGAAIGCFLALILLESMGVLHSLIMSAFVLMLAATASFPLGLRARKYALGALLCIGAFLATSLLCESSSTSLVNLKYIRGKELGKPEFEAWNSYSQVIVRNTGNPLMIVIDQKAATPLYYWKGNRTDLLWLKNDISNIAYHLRPIKTPLVIGVGGGRDVLSAIAFKAEDITGIEMNRINYQLLTKIYADFSGNIHKRKGVSIINAEARSFIEQSKKQYDLIQISMIDTWAATAAGAFALSENGLYTVEAWRTFLHKLNPNGILSLTRWYTPIQHPGELYRMLTVASTALSQEGVARPQDHIAAKWQGGMVTLLISKSPITAEEIEKLKTNKAAVLILAPNYAMNPDMEKLLANENVENIGQSIYADLTPSVDDRPFFFNMVSLKQVLSEDITNLGITINTFNLKTIYHLIWIFVAASAIAALIFGVSLLSAIKSAPTIKRQQLLISITYFTMIGLGFMLIELALLQRFTLFLGHPTYALSVVLSVLLLSSGAGSFLTQKIHSQQQEIRYLSLLFVLLVVSAVIAPPILTYFRGSSDAVRIAICTIILAACGLLMGMAMPIGIRRLNRIGAENIAPWLWGINGAASIVASVLGMIISIFFGFSAAFICGTACYGVCAALHYLSSAKE